MGKVLLALAVILAFASACGSKPKAPGCKSDKDCKNGLVCNANKCVECKTDAQCPKGKTCSANACVAKAQCLTDDQCPNGQVCQAGSCKACASDGECGPGGKCDSGMCQRPKKCSNGLCLKQSLGRDIDAGCQLQTIYFAFDDSSVQPSERDHLDGNSQCIAKNKTQTVLLIGHTDTSGTEEYNIALSERRAQSVADYLARLGTDPARMQVVPKGETEPTGQGDEKDRRVEFKWR
jgi:peptidoglycan-associated lipoprotein